MQQSFYTLTTYLQFKFHYRSLQRETQNAFTECPCANQAKCCICLAQASLSEFSPGDFSYLFALTLKIHETWQLGKHMFHNTIFTHSNLTDFNVQINIVTGKISNWFQTNSLILNFNKTHYIQFMAKSKLAINAHISYKDNPINITSCTNFLGLTLDSTLSWKIHIDQLSSKPNSTCYVIRSLKSVISTMNLKTIYFSYVHSVIAHGIIFWGNSPHSS
jgi:hypothetical protein